MVYFQSAFLYTTSDGRRRVRVTTLGLRTTTLVSDSFRCSDFGATAAILTRRAIGKLRSPPDGDTSRSGGPLHEAREDTTRMCAKIMGNYRLHTSARNSPLGQLILPETLQLLQLFCLGLHKSRGLYPDLHRASFPPGDWTDDTDQLVLILQTLLENWGRENGVLFASKKPFRMNEPVAAASICLQ